MTDTDKLEFDSQLGEKASYAYNQFIKDFIVHKKQVLFDTMADIPVSDIESLQEVKRHLTVLNSLEVEIQDIIQTGKWADSALKEKLGKH